MIRRPLASALRAAAVALAMALSATASAAVAGPAARDLRVELEGGLLTLDARAVPLDEVMRALAAQAGFELTLIGDFSKPVTVTVDREPLGPALERLVRDINRVIVYTPVTKPAPLAPQVAQLWLFGAGEAGPQTDPPPRDDRQEADGKARSLALLRLATGMATEDALPALAAVLQDDPAPLVRSRAAIALGALGDARALPALEAALLDPHASVRTQAISALGQIGGEGATAVLGEFVLSGADGGQRALAVRALWRQDSELAQHYLDAAADDPDARVRAESKAPPAADGDGAPGAGEAAFESTR